MKIHLVEDATPTDAAVRTPFSTCPLCQAGDFSEARPGGIPEAASTPMPWLVCQTCGHLFAQGYPGEDATSPVTDAPRVCATQRLGAGRIVHRVCELRGAVGGLWLETRVSDGALLGAVHEFGFDVLGLAPDESTVDRLTEIGLPVTTGTIEALEGEALFDVISLVGCLERVPFPAATLAHTRRLLRPGGLLFLSLPNVDSSLWRDLDLREENPHWKREDCLHGFSREHIYWLLRKEGFEPCDFTLSELTPVGMDICAMATGA
jgi:protein O-GlcNAc transferase